MADYRELSQEYAHGGIKAIIVVNGGAAAALLTQLSDLGALAGAVLWAMIFWAVGVTLGTLCWFVGFLSNRYVDKHERNEPGGDHLRTSNVLMQAGMTMGLIAIALFLVGSIILAWGFYYSHAS